MPKKGFALWELLIVLVVFGVCYYVVDAVGRGRSRARSIACASNLKQIGKAIFAYRAKHNGSAPRNLSDLFERKLGRFLLRCPNNFPKTGNSDYAYRLIDKPQPDDIICWDIKPEVWGNDITNRTYPPLRNVLRSNGKVQRLSEDDFQKLHL